MGIDEQRREAVERLRALTLEGGSHEMLSAIARAVMPDAGAWTVGACRGLRDRLVALIGRGDEWARGFDEGFASADDWLGQHEDEMAEHGWIRLPKDADGEYIHAGDVLDGYGKTIEVVELRHGRSGWLLISRDGNGYDDTFAFTHHHAPTVEDVLREMLDAWGELPSNATNEAIIAEFAAKLRLAGDAE